MEFAIKPNTKSYGEVPAVNSVNASRHGEIYAFGLNV
jgi:hypothetical protein